MAVASGVIFARSPDGAAAKPIPVYTYEVLRHFPHDPSAFTQGLTYYNGFFYEGTGLNGRSSVRQVRVEAGQLVRKFDLPEEYFGEGIAVFQGQLIELTWQSHIGFVFSLPNFQQLRSFSYAGEGWGITTDGRELFMSDGSSQIRILDPSSFSEKRRIKVHDGPKEIDQLNELEFVDREIYANVWQTDRIARISPETGAVLGWIDLSGLLSPIYHLPQDAVLNGIAYDPQRKRLFVTGKMWPQVFQVRIVPKTSNTRKNAQ